VFCNVPGPDSGCCSGVCENNSSRTECSGLPNGRTCTDDGQCQNGHCTNGVCTSP
jgi:hypothetical protein